MVLGFSLLVFGYDVVWGVNGRPIWISAARTYPFLNASSEELMTMIADRREEAAKAADYPKEDPTDAAKLKLESKRSKPALTKP
jgi:membrane protein required for colicin V production